mmetsp:Transcript_62053/g.176255  ORF Transcript_62053/g.176255 Transcript_62053/m.176255 type:complete len:267 (-) Transcript_62053:400-1200(-)
MKVLFNLPDDTLHLARDITRSQRLLLHGRYHAHDLHEDAHQHVHDRERRQQHKEKQQAGQEVALGADHVHDVGQVLPEAAVEQQGVHGIGHRVEVLVPHCRTPGHQREGDGEDVDDADQQAQRAGHGPGRHGHALDEDHQLRACSHDPDDPGHAQHAEQPQAAQDAGVPQQQQLVGLHARERHDERDGPGLDDHQQDQHTVKHEPRVRQRAALLPEGQEAHGNLKDKISAEQVLENLELDLRFRDEVGGVHVRVYGHPNHVAEYDE